MHCASLSPWSFASREALKVQSDESSFEISSKDTCLVLNCGTSQRSSSSGTDTIGSICFLSGSGSIFDSGRRSFSALISRNGLRCSRREPPWLILVEYRIDTISIIRMKAGQILVLLTPPFDIFPPKIGAGISVVYSEFKSKHCARVIEDVSAFFKFAFRRPLADLCPEAYNNRSGLMDDHVARF